MRAMCGKVGRCTYSTSGEMHRLDVPHTGRIGQPDFSGWVTATWQTGERADVAVSRQLESSGASSEQIGLAMDALGEIGKET